jgi:hypothetical protein
VVFLNRLVGRDVRQGMFDMSVRGGKLNRLGRDEKGALGKFVLLFLALMLVAAMLIATNTVPLLGLILISAPWFFLPTIVAFCLRNPYLPQVAIVNFFLGATVVGWAVALLLATMRFREN